MVEEEDKLEYARLMMDVVMMALLGFFPTLNALKEKLLGVIFFFGNWFAGKKQSFGAGTNLSRLVGGPASLGLLLGCCRKGLV